MCFTCINAFYVFNIIVYMCVHACGSILLNLNQCFDRLRVCFLSHILKCVYALSLSFFFAAPAVSVPCGCEAVILFGTVCLCMFICVCVCVCGWGGVMKSSPKTHWRQQNEIIIFYQLFAGGRTQIKYLEQMTYDEKLESFL